MNRTAHIYTGMIFFFGYQKYYYCLYNLTDKIDWIKLTVFNNGHLYYSFWQLVLLILITIWGSVFPDIDLKIGKFIYNDPFGKKRYFYHRQYTHSLLLWTVLFFFSAYTVNPYLFYFALGGVSHLFGDMITGSIPIFLYGKYYGPFRIGVDRIYRNPAFYSKFARFLDKTVPAISIGLAFFWILDGRMFYR